MKKSDYVSLIESKKCEKKDVVFDYQLLLPIGAQIDDAIEIVMKFLKVLEIDRENALQRMEKNEEQAIEVDEPEKE